MKFKIETSDMVFVIVLSFLLGVLIILLSTFLIIRDIGFYEAEAEKNKVYDKFWNPYEAKVAYENLVNYFNDRDKLFNTYDKSEVKHLADVKKLIKNLKEGFLILSVLLFVVLSFLWRKKYRYLWMIFVGGFLSVVLIFLFLYIFSIFNFSTLFDGFHRIFFAEGSWVFDEHSFLIKLFPIGLFVDGLMRILYYSLFFGFVVLSIGILVKKTF